MPEVILRGKAGVPQTKQEGNTIVVKKDIANAVLEERIPARKMKGKQAQLAVFSKAELDSKVAAAKKETADLVHSNARELMANSEKQILETSEKKLAEKARHMKGKVAAAKKATQTSKKATQTAKAAGKAAGKAVGARDATIARLTDQAVEDESNHVMENAKLKSKVNEQRGDITRLRQERNTAREAVGGAGGTATPKAKAAPMTPAQRGRSRTPAR